VAPPGKKAPPFEKKEALFEKIEAIFFQKEALFAARLKGTMENARLLPASAIVTNR
jgi:hypothetical protein